MNMSHSSQSQRSLSISFSDMIPDKGESEYDAWLQIKYLPSGFKIDNHDIENIQKQQRWLRRLRCDLRELCHMSSFKIIIVWVLSIFIFISYITGSCSPIRKVAKVSSNISLSTTTTTIVPISLNQSQSNLVLLRNIIFRSVQSTKPDCLVLTIFSLVDFVASHIFMLLLFFYVLHMVEVTPNFPWYWVEIIYALFYMFLIFLLALAVCITSKEIIIVVLALIQCIFAMFYIIKKYYQLKSGRQPQDMSDDIDGDYGRRMKNMFHLKSPEENYRKNKFLQEQQSLKGKESNRKSNQVDVFKNVKHSSNTNKNTPIHLNSLRKKQDRFSNKSSSSRRDNGSRRSSVKSVTPRFNFGNSSNNENIHFTTASPMKTRETKICRTTSLPPALKRLKSSSRPAVQSQGSKSVSKNKKSPMLSSVIGSAIAPLQSNNNNPSICTTISTLKTIPKSVTSRNSSKSRKSRKSRKEKKAE